ncbi:DUF4351 domain-containing protein [Magnetovirga frankeli]|uniref:DUF4351 domain-containing protein n=1 Tax=Magnetovirga frankeli TaxID=947516 RepID=UPI0012938950|nr:DUF4351 domain-containing protein [gamma proteobacterium SS-5]
MTAVLPTNRHELTDKTRVIAAFRLEQQSNPDNLREIIETLKHWLADRPDLRKIFAHWIRGSLMRRAEYRIVLPEVNDLEELNVALADRVEQWAKDYRAEGMRQGMQQGLQQGMQQGEALALQRLLRKRFGEIPAGVAEQISRASAEQIEGWLDQVLEASSLESLFGNIH